MKKSWRDRDLNEFVSAPWLSVLIVAAIVIGFLLLWFWVH